MPCVDVAKGLHLLDHLIVQRFGIAYVVAELLGAFIGVRLFAILRAGSEDGGRAGRVKDSLVGLAFLLQDCCCDIEEYIEMCVPRLSARLLGEGCLGLVWKSSNPISSFLGRLLHALPQLFIVPTRLGTFALANPSVRHALRPMFLLVNVSKGLHIRA